MLITITPKWCKNWQILLNIAKTCKFYKIVIFLFYSRLKLNPKCAAKKEKKNFPYYKKNSRKFQETGIHNVSREKVKIINTELLILNVVQHCLLHWFLQITKTIKDLYRQFNKARRTPNGYGRMAKKPTNFRLKSFKSWFMHKLENTNF